MTFARLDEKIIKKMVPVYYCLKQAEEEGNTRRVEKAQNTMDALIRQAGLDPEAVRADPGYWVVDAWLRSGDVSRWTMTIGELTVQTFKALEEYQRLKTSPPKRLDPETVALRRQLAVYRWRYYRDELLSRLQADEDKGKYVFGAWRTVDLLEDLARYAGTA